MNIKDGLKKQKKPLIAFGVWLLFLMLVAGLGSGAVQTAGIVLLLLSVLIPGCLIVFHVMRAIH